MKWLLILVLVAAAGAGGYYLFALHPAPAAVAATATSAPVSTPAPASAPPPVLAPPPEVKHLAPPGVYYLLQQVSITNDSGVIGFTPGTKVTLVKDKGRTWLVTDGETQFEAAPGQFTNDLDVATALMEQIKSQEMADASAASQLKQQEIDRKLQQLEALRKAEEAIQAQANARQSAAAPASTPAADSGQGNAPSQGYDPVQHPFGRPGP